MDMCPGMGKGSRSVLWEFEAMLGPAWSEVTGLAAWVLGVVSYIPGGF